jgi:hypothetical protein
MTKMCLTVSYLLTNWMGLMSWSGGDACYLGLGSEQEELVVVLSGTTP